MNSINIISQAAKKDQLTHAYLAPAKSGTDLRSYAKELGQIILCSSANQSCRQKVLRDSHPDLIWVSILNDKSKISINQVEEIISSSSYSPVEADRKLYVINRAEDLSSEGANSLLKILEDPPEFVYFLLLTETPGSLLPTIISRCQQLPRGGTSLEGMKNSLMDEGFAEKEVDYLLEVANYRSSQVNDLLRDEFSDPLDTRDEARANYGGMDLVELSKTLKKCENYVEKDVIARKIFDQIDGASRFQLIESASALSKLSESELTWFLERGLNLYRNKYRETVSHGGFTGSGESLRVVRRIEHALDSLRNNVNIQLLIESVWLQLREAEGRFNESDRVNG